MRAADMELTPKLLPGQVVNITDVSVVIELKGRMGMLHLPLRSVISDTKMNVGDETEICISYARIINNTL